MRVRWPAEVKERALALYLGQGAAEASRQTGIAAGTIASWAHRNDLQRPRPERTRAAVEAAMADREQRVSDLADDLLKIARDRAQHLSAGITAESEREMATVMGIAVDKMLLLTGKATVRVETITAEHRETLGKLLELKQAS